MNAAGLAWRPDDITGARALTARAAARVMIREGVWSRHDAASQLDTIWCLAHAARELVIAEESAVVVEMWAPLARLTALLLDSPDSLAIVAPLLDASRRYVLALTLADNTADLITARRRLPVLSLAPIT